MARTALTPVSWVANNSLADPAGTTLNAGAGNGHLIPNAKPELTVLRVTAGATGGDVTVLAGDYPPALASVQGDLVVNVPNNTTRWIGPFESGRFIKANGELHIDVADGMTGTITAFLVPRNT